MQNLQALLAAVEDLTLSVRTGTVLPDTLWIIEFLSTAEALRSDAVYLLQESELPGLSARAPLPAAVFFVACAGETPPALPPEVPDAATVIFARGSLTAIYARLNRCLDVLRVRSRIDDVFLLAENMDNSPEQLILSLSQMLGLGVYILNASYQHLSGAAADFVRNPYIIELAETGALSPESVRTIRSGGDGSAILYEVVSKKWSRFFVLLIWRPGKRLDAQYLCRRLADFVEEYRKRNAPPDIPPFLIDRRLNRILEGIITEEAEIRAFFGLGSAPVWFSVIVLGAERDVHWSDDAYQRQALLLRSAFRNVSITVARSQVCAVVQLPVLLPKDNTFSRSFFDERAYNEGWDPQRLEHELQQCGVYLCCSSIFQAPNYFPVEFQMISDALDIAIRLEGCRGRRIVDFHDYSSFLAIKFAMERLLQHYSPVSLRAVLHPEMVTLLLHDQRNHTDLVETLYHYYSYGDVNRAAQALFVHRNTVYNKLKTIRNLLNVDLDDSAFRSSCLSSLQVYYYCEKCLGMDMHSQ